MVDIVIEILASSVPVQNGFKSRYRIKTWWAHIDVPPDKTLIKLPRLPMIQQYLVMTGKDTTMFVETWQEDGGNLAFEEKVLKREDVVKFRPTFIGMTVCTIDEQLKTPTLNPSVQWLDVRDPIENVQRGKLLLKIDAKFALPTGTATGSDKNGFANNTQSDSHLQPGLHYTSRHMAMATTSFPVDPRNLVKDNGISCRSIQSDASVISGVSAVSISSQDQGVQTDLSLPIFPDVSTSCYNNAILQPKLHSHSTSEEKEYYSRKPPASLSRQNREFAPQRRLLSDAPSVKVDPLQIAEDIIYRNFKANNQKSSSINTSNSLSSNSQMSRNVRRSHYSHVSKQKQHQLPLTRYDNEKVEHSGAGDEKFGTVEDAIDILNQKIQHSVPSFNETEANHQKVRENSMDRDLDLDPRSRLAPEGSSTLSRQSGGNKTKDHSTVINSSPSAEASRVQRFKEVHFDGSKAHQEATTVLMNRITHSVTETSKSNPQPHSKPPLPVMRRRIAAAIFNDDS